MCKQSFALHSVHLNEEQSVTLRDSQSAGRLEASRQRDCKLHRALGATKAKSQHMNNALHYGVIIVRMHHTTIIIVRMHHTTLIIVRMHHNTLIIDRMHDFVLLPSIMVACHLVCILAGAVTFPVALLVPVPAGPAAYYRKTITSFNTKTRTVIGSDLHSCFVCAYSSHSASNWGKVPYMFLRF
jgi:hypothetical protein